MATKEQIARANKLIEVVKIDDETVTKWMTKADVDEFSEMTGDQIQKVIDFLEKKVEGIVKVDEPAKKGAPKK